ncbi:hypothetical protein BT69DRAFT_1290770 [Atractiella rhizophila]|nr:hypothetical protein BT69DRAFT_1290770 [Atractiella rhizophila]
MAGSESRPVPILIHPSNSKVTWKSVEPAKLALLLDITATRTAPTFVPPPNTKPALSALPPQKKTAFSPSNTTQSGRDDILKNKTERPSSNGTTSAASTNGSLPVFSSWMDFDPNKPSMREISDPDVRNNVKPEANGTTANGSTSSIPSDLREPSSLRQRLRLPLSRPVPLSRSPSSFRSASQPPETARSTAVFTPSTSPPNRFTPLAPPMGRMNRTSSDPVLTATASSAAATAVQPPSRPKPDLPDYTKFLQFMRKLSNAQRYTLLQQLNRASGVYKSWLKNEKGGNRRDGWESSWDTVANVTSFPFSAESATPFGERAKFDIPKDVKAQVEQLLRDIDVWEWIEKQVLKLKQAEYTSLTMSNNGRVTWKVVYVDNLPYLLVNEYAHPRLIPRTPDSVFRAEAVYHVLTNISAIVSISHNVETTQQRARLMQLANTRLLQRPLGRHQDILDGLGIGLGGPAVDVRAGGLGAAGAGGRRGVAIIINLTVVVQILYRLFLLCAKLGVLFLLFGRHVSPTKRFVILGLAFLYFLYQARQIIFPNADADRAAARNRPRRAPRPANPVPAPAEGNAGANPPAAEPGPELDRLRQALQQAGVGAGNARPAAPAALGRGMERAAPAPVPPAGNNRPPTPTPTIRRRAAVPAYTRYSVFTPKYWIMRMASVGLMTEARELQVPLSSRSTVPPPPLLPEENTALKRTIRMTWTATVLFFGTLIPEVEKKRKRALEKRQKQIAQKRIDEAKKRAEEANARATQATEAVAAASMPPNPPTEPSGPPVASTSAVTIENAPSTPTPQPPPDPRRNNPPPAPVPHSSASSAPSTPADIPPAALPLEGEAHILDRGDGGPGPAAVPMLEAAGAEILIPPDVLNAVDDAVAAEIVGGADTPIGGMDTPNEGMITDEEGGDGEQEAEAEEVAVIF